MPPCPFIIFISHKYSCEQCFISHTSLLLHPVTGNALQMFVAGVCNCVCGACAGAGQDFAKELQFQKLNALKDVMDVKVVRGGRQLLVPSTDLVRGSEGSLPLSYRRAFLT